MRSIVAALLASLIGVAAVAQTPEAEGPHTLVLVVLHPLQKGQKQLEPAEFGGTLKTRAGSRLAVRVPEAAIEALKRDPRVKYVQRVVFGDAPHTVAASMRMTTAPDSAGLPEVTVNGTGSVTIGPYAYDGSGNVYEIRGTLTGAEHTDTFTYDGAGRLKSATVHAFDVARTESYVYDSPGNLIQLHTGGTVIELPVEASTNRLRSSHGFAYDGVGNMIGTPLASGYQYDHVEMLRATDRHQYIYTADDERLAVMSREEEEDPWKWTLRDLSKKPVREYESFGLSDDRDFLWKGDHFYGGGTAVAAQRELAEGGLRHFHADHLGTPRLITNSAGGRISTHVYYPFGVEITSVTQERALGYEDEEHIAFTGHERDGMESGGVDHSQYLDFMHARYYNPNWGRFLSVDPTWESADLTKPQSWNRYSYVRNNPANFTDPDGRNAAVVGGGVIAGGLVAARLCASNPGCVRAVVSGAVGLYNIFKDMGRVRPEQVAVGPEQIELGTSLANSEDATSDDSSAQDKRLSKGEIKALQGADVDPEALKIETTGDKRSGPYDLFKDKDGNIKVKPKDGKGPGEPTGLNINDFVR